MPPTSAINVDVHQHAGAGDPVDAARADSPGGPVFPSRARYELLADRSGQGREGADGALRGAVRVEQAEADDPGGAVGLGLVMVEPGEDLARGSRGGSRRRG